MKEFFHQYRKLAIIAGVASVIFVILFIIFYDTNDLFRLPFNSSVWGTASDWIMIVVTFFTAIYLVKTFREQQEITKIEQGRYLQEILPSPTIESHLLSSTEGETRILFKNNHAFNVIIKNLSSSEGITFVKFLPNMTMSGATFGPQMPVIVRFTVEEGKDLQTIKMIFHMNFSDKIGTKYFQEFVGFPHKDLISRAPVKKEYEFND